MENLNAKLVGQNIETTWRNSLKSAVVGGGDGELTENEHGDWRQLDEAGERLELGVAVSQYLHIEAC